MRTYEKFNLLLTFLALLAAAWVGLQQLNINHSILELNYEPALTVLYSRELISPEADGLQFINNGKTKIFFYQYYIYFNDENKKPIDTSGETVILPGGTLYSTSGQDITSQLLVRMGTSTDRIFPMDIFFKTANKDKYILRTYLRIYSSNNQWMISLGRDNYRLYDWLEKK